MYAKQALIGFIIWNGWDVKAKCNLCDMNIYVLKQMGNEDVTNKSKLSFHCFRCVTKLFHRLEPLCSAGLYLNWEGGKMEEKQQ